MWKVRCIVKGAGIIHFRSSTEPCETRTPDGQRLLFNFTPIENDTEGDTLGLIDWSRDDLWVTWRPEKKKGADGRPKTKTRSNGRLDASKPAKPTHDPKQVELAVIAALQDGAVMTEDAIAEVTCTPRPDIETAVTSLLKRDIISIFGPTIGNKRKVRNRSRYARIMLSG